MKSLYMNIALELRIGNWVIDSAGNYVQVIGIPDKDFVRVQLEDQNHIHSQTWIFSIPITVKLLESAGFKVDESGYWYLLRYLSERGGLKEVYYIQINPESFWCGITDNDEDQCNSVFNKTKVKYLHQLQNFVYSVTGEELDFKF